MDELADSDDVVDSAVPDLTGGNTVYPGAMTSPETNGLAVAAQPHGDALVLIVSGEIDIVTAPRFQEAVESALADEPSSLVIDLSEITFLASAGLGVLAALVAGNKGEAKIKVVATGPVTARPLTLTGLNDVIAVYPTRREALAEA